jgi:regulator of cell morphogenesis and NO signaling
MIEGKNLGCIKRGGLAMENSNVVFSKPLQQLMDEHVSLRKAMNHFYDLTEEIESEPGHEVVQLFAKLHEQVSAFTMKLKAHSKREDEGLFPMISRRLGEGDRTIEIMEEEHEKAEGHLQDFLTEAEQAGDYIDEQSAQWITVYAVQAYATLTQHFAKEEKVLFPLAEKLLSIDEKMELEHCFIV